MSCRLLTVEFPARTCFRGFNQVGKSLASHCIGLQTDLNINRQVFHMGWVLQLPLVYWFVCLFLCSPHLDRALFYDE